jgi:hypothetical protein
MYMKTTKKAKEAKDTTKMKAVVQHTVAENNAPETHTETPVQTVPITPGSAVAVVQRMTPARRPTVPTTTQLQLTMTASNSAARALGDTNVKPTMRLTIQKSGDSQKGNTSELGSPSWVQWFVISTLKERNREGKK